MSSFSHSTDVRVRYADADPLGHVNNAVYAMYLEEARADYYDAVLGPFPEHVTTVVANLNLDFRREIRYRDDVTVAVRVEDLGDSSFEMVYEVQTGETV